jgi:DNA-binding CsgD family transcriptional regulator
MRHWTVAAAPSTVPIAQRVALQGVERLGGAGFAAALLGGLRTGLDFDHCTLFRFDVVAPGEVACRVVDAASGAGTPTARRTSDLYVRRFARLDVNAALSASVPPGQVVATQVTTADVTDAEYRACCYERNGLVDRLSLLARSGRRSAVALNFYRAARAGVTTDRERSTLLDAAPMLMGLAMRHAELVDVDAAAAIRRLPGGDRLTPRELDACALLVEGWTVAQAADRLGVRPSTVVTLKRRAFARLELRTTDALLRRLSRPAPV